MPRRVSNPYKNATGVEVLINPPPSIAVGSARVRALQPKGAWFMADLTGIPELHPS